MSFAPTRTLAYNRSYKFSFSHTHYDRDWESISLIYPDQYHTPEELIEELEQVNSTAPGIVDLFSIGSSFEGREIYCVRITNENNTGHKPGTLIIGQHHAREQITMEMALRFILRLVNEYDTNNEISELIDMQQIYIIPTLNPDGLHYVVGNKTIPGDPWLRKNARQFDDDGDGLFDEDAPEDLNSDGIISGYDVYTKSGNNWVYIYSYWEGNDTDNDGEVNEDPIGGVDLNRNYDYRWNDSTLDSGWGRDTRGEDYPGSAPFSEPETMALRAFLEGKSFATAMSLHSGINQTYFPWGSTGAWAEHDLYTSIYSDFRTFLPPGYLAYINYGFGIGYTIAGDWADWMYDFKECLVPMTFELYHNRSSTYQVEKENDSVRIERLDDIYGYFNPTGTFIPSLWEDIKLAFDYWLELTPRLLVTSYSAIGGNKTGDTLSIRITVRNLSPWVPTVKGITVVDDNFDSIRDTAGSTVTMVGIEGGKTTDLSFNIFLESDLGSDNELTFLIGNRFVGWAPIVITAELITSSQSSPFEVMAMMAALPLLILFQKKLKKKELQ
ncbi:MAG: M14 family zinc carboxypeptidase [Candidatus Thorarchaeota archaeon]